MAAVLLIGLFFAFLQARRAVAAEQVTHRNAYAAEMNVAFHTLVAENNLGRARELLNRQRPGKGEKEDLVVLNGAIFGGFAKVMSWKHSWMKGHAGPRFHRTASFSPILSPTSSCGTRNRWKNSHVERPRRNFVFRTTN